MNEFVSLSVHHQKLTSLNYITLYTLTRPVFRCKNDGRPLPSTQPQQGMNGHVCYII